MNWAEISNDLLFLEKRIDQKLEKIVSKNPDPFPFDRLRKGKELRAVCRGNLALVQLDQTDDARLLLGVLDELKSKISGSELEKENLLAKNTL